MYKCYEVTKPNRQDIPKMDMDSPARKHRETKVKTKETIESLARNGALFWKGYKMSCRTLANASQ